MAGQVHVKSMTLAFSWPQGYRATWRSMEVTVRRAAVVLAVGILMLVGSVPVAKGREDWALYRETVIPREERLQIKYPLFTLRKTRRDCLRRLYAELSDVLLGSFPPDRNVEGIEAKQAGPGVWVYRRAGSGGRILYELRFSCLPDTSDPREKQ